MNLRKRLENSEKPTTFFSWILAGYLRFCFSSTRWQVRGMQDLADALADGPGGPHRRDRSRLICQKVAPGHYAAA